MSLNFAEIANKKVEEIERPPLPPVGTYRWRITKLPESTTSNNGEWDILTIPVQAVEALENVETDDYDGDITNIRQTLRFMFNKQDEAEFEKSLYRVRTFFEKHVKCVEDGDSVGQMMNNSVNGEFLGDIVWNADKNDPEVMYANMGRTAPVD